eukprot:gene1943-5032_t
MEKSQCTYTSCYCEENVWKLLNDQAPKVAKIIEEKDGISIDKQPWAACFISNHEKHVAVAQQQSSCRDDGIVVWDYHVIAIGPDESSSLCVYDLDTRLPFPYPIYDYWKSALQISCISDNLKPLFRIVRREHLLQTFSSDRSHMLRNGGYIHPPPSYPAIKAGYFESPMQHF